jgi:hypothetical protein
MRNNSKSRKQLRRERFQQRLIEETICDMDMIQDDGVNKHLKDLAQIRLDRAKERLVELGMS